MFAIAHRRIPVLFAVLVPLLGSASTISGCRSRPRPTAPTDGVPEPSAEGPIAPALPRSSSPTAAKEPPTDTIAYSGTFGPTTRYATLNVGGKPRRVYVYVPSRRAAKPALVVAFHGTGANTSEDAHDAAMGELSIREVADAHGFVVVAPLSTNDGGVNADHEGGGDGFRFDGTPDTNGDLLLTRASIQEARRAFGVDPTRVYSVGHSNGAFFAYFAAMKLADRFAAFAESSGGLIPCGKRVDCELAKPGATSCAAVLSGANAACRCAIGDSAFPTFKPKSGRVPLGFLKHNADDSTVSPVFTCRLGEHLGNRAQVTIDGAGEHGPTNDFMAKAWAFFSTKSLAD